MLNRRALLRSVGLGGVAGLRLRRGTAAAWTGADPTLASGEVGVETDAGNMKRRGRRLVGSRLPRQRIDEATTFASADIPPVLIESTPAVIDTYDTGGTPGERRYRFGSNGGSWRVRAMSDDGATALSTPFRVTPFAVTLAEDGQTIDASAAASVTVPDATAATHALNRQSGDARYRSTSGLLTARPAASSDNAGALYFATDANGGTVYRSTGSGWAQIAASVANPNVLIAHKSANETVNNSTIPQADDHLTLTVASATTYLVEGCLLYSSSPAADLKFRFANYDSGTGAILDWGSPGPALTSTAQTRASIMVRQNKTAAQVGGVAVGTGLIVPFMGSLTTGSTATNIVVEWAQNIADATDTVVHRGSWVKLTKVA